MVLKNFIKKFINKTNNKSSKESSFDEKLFYFKCRTDKNKVAIITDALGDKYFCEVDYNKFSYDNFALGLFLFDQDFKLCSHMTYYRINGKLFLSSLYTTYTHRGRGLAHKMDRLSNYILQNEAGTLIFGNYEPFNLPYDSSIPPSLTKEKRDDVAKKFYNSAGYKFIKEQDYKRNPKDYPEISQEDFTSGENPPGIIIIKKVEKLKNYPFHEENNIIIECESEKEFVLDA